MPACASGPASLSDSRPCAAMAYSFCAETSSGLYTSASGWPRPTGWPVALTCSFSIQPSNFGETVCRRRSSTSMRPLARTLRDSSRSAAISVRTPSFCTFSVLMTMPLSEPAVSSPSYTGM